MNLPRIKICCISSAAEAELAVDSGASAVGLVSEMPSGPGPIPESAITQIAATVPPGVDAFLLTCSQDATEIIGQQRRTGATVLQLCDSIPFPAYGELRAALPGIRLVQVIHVTGPESIEEAQSAAPHVHALLLDSGRPSLAVKELGGTGRVHDWLISRQIRQTCRTPVFLAGGLKPDNVAEAIRVVEPFGVDVCSGVRTGGQLDAAKLSEFVRAVASTGGF